MDDRSRTALETALERAERRRDALAGAVRRLEEALEHDGRETSTVLAAISTLEEGLASHRAGAEDVASFLLEEAPRLEGKVRLLMAEHTVLARAAAGLRSRLESGQPLGGLRPQLLGLARTVRSHLDHATELVWEAVGAEVVPAD